MYPCSVSRAHNSYTIIVCCLSGIDFGIAFILFCLVTSLVPIFSNRKPFRSFGANSLLQGSPRILLQFRPEGSQESAAKTPFCPVPTDYSCRVLPTVARCLELNTCPIIVLRQIPHAFHAIFLFLSKKTQRHLPFAFQKYLAHPIQQIGWTSCLSLPSTTTPSVIHLRTIFQALLAELVL